MAGGEDEGGIHSSEGVLLATGGYDHTIRLWQAHSGLNHKTFQHTDSQVNCLEITPDRQLLAAAGYQHIRMYDITSNNPSPVIQYEGIKLNITALGFTEDGKWLYTGGEDCNAKIWDLRSHSLQAQSIFQVSAAVNCAWLHPNQVEMIVGDQSGHIHIWDLRNNHNERLIPETQASIQSVSIDDAGTWMAAVNNKGNCYVWSLKSGEGEERTKLTPRSKIPAHPRYALKCKFSPDSSLLATTSADGTCKLWNTSDFSLSLELSVNNTPKSSSTPENSADMEAKTQRWVWDLAFSADSQYIFTASSDHLSRLWSVQDGCVKREYDGHQKAVTCLAFRDGQT